MIAPLVVLAAAAAHCTRGGEYRPSLCPTGLPPIVALTLERNGTEAWVVKEQRPDCRRFRLTVAEARRYLSRARRTDEASADATMLESPCHASGHLRLADGRRAAWDIDQFGEAHLELPGHQRRLILFCPQCLRPPFLQ